MSAFVALSIGLAVVVLAVTAVVAWRLVTAVRHSVADISARLERLGPLAQELGDELAVTQTELDQLQRRTDRGDGSTRGG